jgi:hypothetical protein
MHSVGTVEQLIALEARCDQWLSAPSTPGEEQADGFLLLAQMRSLLFQHGHGNGAAGAWMERLRRVPANNVTEYYAIADALVDSGDWEALVNLTWRALTMNWNQAPGARHGCVFNDAELIWKLSIGLENLGRDEEVCGLYAHAWALGLPKAPRDIFRVATLMPRHLQSVAVITSRRKRYRQNLVAIRHRNTIALENPDQPWDDVAFDFSPGGFFLAYWGLPEADALHLLSETYLRAAPSLGYVSPELRMTDDGVYEWDPPPLLRRRIRVAFISAFNWAHAAGKMLAGIVPFLSRNDFEVGIFFAASRPGVLPYHNPNDRIQTMLKQRADFTRDIVWTSLAAIQREIEQYRLDILVYPAIGMEPMTYFLAHSRLARVQLATHGHASTTGIASSIDFFVSYKSFEVASAQKHYSERLVTVRGLVRYPMPLAPPSAGLPVLRQLQGQQVFIVPQTSQKIGPMFDLVWKRILQRIPAARIVMKKPYVYERPTQSAAFTRLLRDRMQTVFKDEALFSRLVFIDGQQEGGWFDLFRGSVAMLDSYPYGGYTSTLEALALELPVVTLPHSLMSGRCTAAFLRVCRTPELIAADMDEYVDIAEQIAINETFSRSVRERIKTHSKELYADAANNDAVHGWSRLMKEVNIGLPPSDLHGTEEERQQYGLWSYRHDVGPTSTDDRLLWKLGLPQHCSAL